MEESLSRFPRKSKSLRSVKPESAVISAIMLFPRFKVVRLVKPASGDTSVILLLLRYRISQVRQAP